MNTSWKRAGLVAAAVVLWLSGNGQCADDRPPGFSAAAVWERFVTALQRGDYEGAYALFSPSSRAVFSYEEFCAHHHPLTLTHEAILTPASRSQFQVDGDLARLRFIAAAGADEERLATVAKGSPRGVMVSALLVRENGGWHLVAGKREHAALAEAETRNFLRHLVSAQPEVKDLLHAGKPVDAETLRGLLPQAFDASQAKLLGELYDFRIMSRGGSVQLCALARQTELRSFAMGIGGAPVAFDATGSKPTVRRKAEPRLRDSERFESDELPEMPAGYSAVVTPPQSPEKKTPPTAEVDRLPERPAVESRGTSPAASSPELPPPPPDLGDPEEAEAEAADKPAAMMPPALEALPDPEKAPARVEEQPPAMEIPAIAEDAARQSRTNREDVAPVPSLAEEDIRTLEPMDDRLEELLRNEVILPDQPVEKPDPEAEKRPPDKPASQEEPEPPGIFDLDDV